MPPHDLDGSGKLRALRDTSTSKQNAMFSSAIRIVDAGDVDVSLDAAVTRERITTHARSIIDQGVLLASIGGDHSISFPLLVHSRNMSR
jgi:arginase family enzyme